METCQGKSTTGETFDVYASDYRKTVEASVGFSGLDLEFFTQAKAYHLRKIGSRLGRPLAEAEVLDVGCGTGGLDGLLIPHVSRLVGVDVSEGMVGRARLANPSGTYLHYDGETLPFQDQTFDLVFAVCVLHHVEPGRWTAFQTEMWRMVRPGGVAVIIEHNPLNPLTRRSVARCPFDEDAVLTRPGPLVQTFHRLGANRVRWHYMLFSPFGGAAPQAIERRALGWIPLGAQYLVVASRESHAHACVGISR